MNDPALSPEERYDVLVEAFLGTPDVALGLPGKKGFRSSALTVNGAIFAMLVKGRLVVKLPRQRVDVLIDSDPGHGRLMKEWLALEQRYEADWLPLAKEAMQFVAAKR